VLAKPDTVDVSCSKCLRLPRKFIEGHYPTMPTESDSRKAKGVIRSVLR